MKKLYVVIASFLLVILLSAFLDKDASVKNETSHLINRNDIEKLLGPSDGVFEDYEVYYDKGISVKYSEVPVISDDWKGCYYNRTGFAENIVLNMKYSSEVLPDISCGTSTSDIKTILGTPDFANRELCIFGYKLEDMYIFFKGTDIAEQISVYPISTDYDTSVVEKALKLCKEEYSQELAEKIISVFEQAWTDYNYSYSIMGRARYSPRSNSMGLAYFDRGVEIYYSPNNDDKAILNLYSNYNGIIPEKVLDSTGRKLIACYKHTDLIFEQEKLRVKNDITMQERTTTEGKISPDGSIIIVDNLSRTGVNVISVDESFGNYTIETSPMQYGAGEWLSDRYFIYYFGKGDIYAYDLLKRENMLISSEYSSIKKIQNGAIVLSSYSEPRDYTVKYEFDDAGEIHIVSD